MPVPLESGLHVNQSSTQQQRWISASSASSFSTATSFDSEGTEESEEGSCWEDFRQQLYNLLFKVLLVQPLMPVQIAQEDEEAFKVREKWIFAAWFLCLTAIFVGGIFIIFYDLKMDFKTSNEWMQNSFRFSLANIFLMSPIKIIIFAVILAVLYGQLQYIPSYECDTDAALNRESAGNVKFLAKILKRRRRNYYRPLNNKETMVIRVYEANWRRWRIVVNWAVVVALYTVLLVEVIFHWDGLYVPTSKNLLRMFDEGRNITSLPSYFEYIMTTALPAMNKKYWYNGQPTMQHEIWKQESGFTRNYFTRLMARPILRQQRAERDSCRVLSTMSDRFGRCYAPLTRFSKGEEEEFSVHWSTTHMPSRVTDNPWAFSDSDSQLLICGLVTEKCYLPGGYISRLDYNLTTSESDVSSLQQSNWLDEATRVVFLELVMYNVNTDLMSYVTPTLEKLADGSFQFGVKATNLHSRPINYTGRLIIILCFTFYYLCRIVLLFNREGLAYIFSSIGLLDIFLNIFLQVTMISMTFYREARKAYIYEWLKSDQEDLIMTKDIFVHRAILRFETAILVVIIPAQLLHNFRFGKRNLKVFKTLSLYSKFALGFGLFWVVFCMAVSQVCIINGKIQEFYNLNDIFGWVSYDSFGRKLPFISTVFLFIVNIISIFSVVISVKCYRDANEYLRYGCDFNIFSFLCEKLKKANIKTSELKKRVRTCFRSRTRAGADNVGCLSTRTCSQVKQMCSDLSSKCDKILEKLTELDNTL